MYKKILFACDLNKDHYELCQQVVAFAKAIRAHLDILYVIQIPASLQWAQSLGFAELRSPDTSEAQAVMHSISEAFHLPQENLHVAVGSRHLVIIEKARAWQSDLLILGRHVDKNLAALPGSTASAIAHHPPCDILTMAG